MDDILIERLPDGPIQPGMEVEFQCIIPRIKPKAKFINREITHKPKLKGKLFIAENEDGTFMQKSVLTQR